MARTLLLAALACMAVAGPVSARVAPFPEGFQVRDIAVEGAVIHVRVGGHGPAVLMLHGFGDTGDMWAPLAAELAGAHTVVVPDLRGMGLSSHPEAGYEKLAQAGDMARVLDALHIGQVDLVTHDIGNMVGFAFAARHRGQVRRWVAMDAPLPGLGHWHEQLCNPKTWHFNFHGPDEERLVRGRERIFLDRFWNELSADPAGIDEPTRRHYAALYARPHAMHDALAQFAAFPQDARDNQALIAAGGRLTIPVLAIGGSASYGASLAGELEPAASQVRPLVIQGSGHWLMEERPAAVAAAVLAFLADP